MEHPRPARQAFRSAYSALADLKWENLLLVAFLLAAPFLVFHNLELNPRPWHDEGFYLTLAKTLAREGIYAVGTSDGYQTFGAIQSLGPTVILPIAWVFRALGAGLFQGRVVSGLYLLTTLILFFATSHLLFGRKRALVSVGLLLASPAVGFLMYGRPVLGEGPALGFFLAGWIAWSTGLRREKTWLFILSGLLVGAAIITKSQYMLIGFALIGIMVALDLFYFRLRGYRGLLILGAVTACCVAAWYGWQISYFGENVFLENSSKLKDLAGVTMGFSLKSSMDAIRFLFGSGSGYLYMFWGFPSLVYAAILASRRSRDGFSIAFFVIFTALWLIYFVFFTIPWSRYIFPAAAILSIFVGKLFIDILAGLRQSSRDVLREMRSFLTGRAALSPTGTLGIGSIVALLTLALWGSYQFQKVIREDVLSESGAEDSAIYSPPQLSLPEMAAEFISRTIPGDAVIDTWERELAILTENKYHYPDASLLAKAHEAIYRESDGSFSGALLGEDYFRSVDPDYVIVGWYARFNNLYDPNYLARHAILINKVGDPVWGYDIYEMRHP